MNKKFFVMKIFESKIYFRGFFTYKLVGWLFSFYGISTISTSYNAKLNNFDKSFKQFSLI